jgi:hypothetical protein
MIPRWGSLYLIKDQQDPEFQRHIPLSSVFQRDDSKVRFPLFNQGSARSWVPETHPTLLRLPERWLQVENPFNQGSARSWIPGRHPTLLNLSERWTQGESPFNKRPARSWLPMRYLALLNLPEDDSRVHLIQHLRGPESRESSYSPPSSTEMNPMWGSLLPETSKALTSYEVSRSPQSSRGILQGGSPFNQG